MVAILISSDSLNTSPFLWQTLIFPWNMEGLSNVINMLRDYNILLILRKKDINMAKQLITQYGGSNGELAAGT